MSEHKESTPESPENPQPQPKRQRRNPNDPQPGDNWLTPEIETLLKAIPGPHEAKKRQTVIRLAFALANQVPAEQVFTLRETCDRRIWYMKWQHDPAIKAAFEACYARALDWADRETALLEEHYRRMRRRSVAEWSAKAPDALAAVMQNERERGGDRISAANALMGWADPKAAEQVRPASPASTIEQVVNLVNNLADDELNSELERMEQRGKNPLLSAPQGTGEPAAGAAEADDPEGEGPGEANT